MKRFRISTLLVLTAFCAGGFVFLRPFEPDVRVFDPVDLNRFHAYYKHAKIYEVSVLNEGGHAVWLPDNSEPFASQAMGHLVGGVNVNAVFVGANARGVTRVDPGEGLVYRICTSESDAGFEVHIETQDWRGRSETIEDHVYVLSTRTSVETFPSF